MINIRVAQQQDMKAVLGLITELAIYEKEPDAVIVTEGDLITHGFSEGRFDCFVAEHDDQGVIGMALYYPRYSTWKGPTLHLEDLVRGTVDHGLYNELPVSEATNEEITVPSQG